MNFGLTLTEVLLMFAYAVPGYLLVKSRLVGEKAIPGFAALLMYVLQPCLCIDSFRQITYTPEAFSRMAWFFIICLVLQALSAAAIYAVSRLVMGERFAAGLLPRGSRLLPEWREMSDLWACRCFARFCRIIRRHPRFPRCSSCDGITLLDGRRGMHNRRCAPHDFKRAFLNPPVIALAVALPLFFTNTRLPASIADPIGLLADMTTPVCMLILGMRFATFPIRESFRDVSYIRQRS